ncbi:MAG: hypothetical protein R2692_00810 [Microbacterium sp.]
MIPGERVRAELTDASKASFWRADVVDAGCLRRTAARTYGPRPT